MLNKYRVLVGAVAIFAASCAGAQLPNAEFKPPQDSSTPSGPIGIAIQEGRKAHRDPLKAASKCLKSTYLHKLSSYGRHDTECFALGRD